MKTPQPIALTLRSRPEGAAKGHAPRGEKFHFDRVIDEPALCYDGDKLVIAYQPDVDADELLGALRRIEYKQDFRTAGLATRSRTFGFQPRIAIRRDFCATTSLAREAPTEHAVLVKWGTIASNEYHRLNPARWDLHETTMREKVKPCWHLPGSVFTSGIANHDNVLRYHYDTGNFPGLWSAMYGFTHDIEGGHLVMPDYGVAFSFAKPAFITFDGQGVMHGVSPVHKQSPRAFRYSVVYYSLQQMCNCLEPAEELRRIRAVKTEREHKRAKRDPGPQDT